MWLPFFAIILNAVATAQALTIHSPQPWKPLTNERSAEHSGHLSPRAEQQHDLENAAQHGGFSRFKWVTGFLQTGDRLARSSAPYFKTADRDQLLTPQSIEFLKQQNIKHIISLNSEANNQAIKDVLRRNNIAYTPLPVKDFSPPTLEDLKKGYRAFKEHRSGTLVWCGYGHGRTGTMISALQVYSEHENTSPKKLLPGDYTKNHVETPDQIRLLEKLQRSLQPGAFRQAAQAAVQGLSNMVGNAIGKATGNNLTKPKPAAQQPKKFDKPGPKPPKFVADVWPDHSPSKPFKQTPKKFDNSMTPSNLGKLSRGPGRVVSTPPMQPGSKINTPKKSHDSVFLAGRVRPGNYMGIPKVKVP